MRLRENYSTLNTHRYAGNYAKGGVLFNSNTSEEERLTLSKRLDDQRTMGARLYQSLPLRGNNTPWGGFTEGYPARKQVDPTGHWGGFMVLESGEIELRSQCGGTPTDCAIRRHVGMTTNHSLSIYTWGERPRLYTKNGKELRKDEVKPLHRYCAPHQADRSAQVGCPAVMVDNDYDIAVPLLPGEGGMYAYWSDEAAMPTTWSSWLVTVENEEVCKIMASALRKLCKYANSVNSMMRGIKTDQHQRAAAHKEAEKVVGEWKNAAHMLGYLQRTRDPEEIAKLMMDEWSMRQIVVLATMASSSYSSYHGFLHIAANGAPGRTSFSKSSSLFRMLKEQTSEQFETKFLYTKPPEHRSNWQLVRP